VHDVVAGGGVLDVAAVDIHGVLKLLRPSLVVHAHRVHVVVGHEHHAVEDAVEFVVVGDGDGRAVDLAHLGASRGLEQLHLEVLVLLEVHVVDDGDADGAVRLQEFKYFIYRSYESFPLLNIKILL